MGGGFGWWKKRPFISGSARPIFVIEMVGNHQPENHWGWHHGISKNFFASNSWRFFELEFHCRVRVIPGAPLQPFHMDLDTKSTWHTSSINFYNSCWGSKLFSKSDWGVQWHPKTWNLWKYVKIGILIYKFKNFANSPCSVADWI